MSKPESNQPQCEGAQITTGCGFIHEASTAGVVTRERTDLIAKDKHCNAEYDQNEIADKVHDRRLKSIVHNLYGMADPID